MSLVRDVTQQDDAEMRSLIRVWQRQCEDLRVTLEGDESGM